MLYCSPQVFARKKNTTGGMVPLGTSVLLKRLDSYFLITARHIYDESSSYDLFIPLSNSFIQVGGKWKYFNTHRQYDNIDIAILSLDQKLISPILTSYKFIISEILEEVDMKSEDNYFIVMGFPVSKTNGNGREFITTPFGFITQQIQLKRINKIALSENDNITVRYSRKEQGYLDAGIKSQGPKDLRGISGGGLWLFKTKGTLSGTIQLSLAGIIIEADINRGIICATRAKWVDLLLKGFLQGQVV